MLLINPYSFVGEEFAVYPDDFPDLFRWYDAASLNYLADGATITPADQWDDLSANNDNVATTLGNEPIFKTNIFGSRPAVRMDGTVGQRLLFNGGAFLLTDFTIFFITERVIQDTFAMTSSTLNRQVRIFRSSANVLSVFTGVETISPVLATSQLVTRLNGWIRSGTAMDFYENDTLLAGGVDGTVLNLNQIGHQVSLGNMDIGEVVIYNNNMSPVDAQSLYDGYFQPKFGLP